jgi:hypothetical protein
MTDALVISDAYRTPIVAQRHMDDPGGVVIRLPAPKSLLILSAAEFDRLARFAGRKPHIQCFPASTGCRAIASRGNLVQTTAIHPQRKGTTDEREQEEADSPGTGWRGAGRGVDADAP